MANQKLLSREMADCERGLVGLGPLAQGRASPCALPLTPSAPLLTTSSGMPIWHWRGMSLPPRSGRLSRGSTVGRGQSLQKVYWCPLHVTGGGWGASPPRDLFPSSLLKTQGASLGGCSISGLHRICVWSLEFSRLTGSICSHSMKTRLKDLLFHFVLLFPLMMQLVGCVISGAGMEEQEGKPT